jgi:hypothetical protein
MAIVNNNYRANHGGTMFNITHDAYLPADGSTFSFAPTQPRESDSMTVASMTAARAASQLPHTSL